MDLLSKFDSVQVTPDNRISEQDKAVCAAHQAAYEAAKSALEELKYMWTDILAQQKTALQGTGRPPTTYVTSSGLDISENHIEKQIQLLHRLFISNLVWYFNETYHVTVSSEEVKNALLPEEPDRYSYSEEDMAQYEKQVQNLLLHSDQIVEQILARLDGRGLWEQAIYELKEKCHKAVWNTCSGKAEYVCKKDVITLSYGCSFKTWAGYGEWELTDTIKSVLRGLAHYETGSFAVTPKTISILLGYYCIKNDRIDFSDCKKIKQLRLFKNRRVDIRFSDASEAKDFTEKYLGTMC